MSTQEALRADPGVTSEAATTAAGLTATSWRWAPPALTVLAAVLAMLSIGERSLWGDEAFSIAQASLPWVELWALLGESQGNMALFHVVLKLWIAVFGDGEVAVRTLSALFAVATVPVVYALGRRLFGQPAAVAAALLLAVNAFFLAYAQEARSYTLLLLLISLSSLIALRIAGGRRTVLLGCAYAVVTALAVTAHTFAIFVVPAHLVGALLLQPGRRALVGQACASVAAVLLSSPILLTVAGQDAGQIGWIIKPSLLDLGRALRDLAGGANLLLVVYFALCVAALLAPLRARLARRVTDWRPVGVILAWLIVPVALSVAISYVAKPLFAPRYLMICLPALVLLAGRGLSTLPRRAAIATGAGVLVLAALALPYLQSDYEEVNFRDATRYVLERSRPGDGIVFYRPSRRLGFEYYQAHSGRPDPGLVPLHPRSRFGDFDLTADYRALELSPADYARLAARSRSGRVWLFTSQNEVPSNRVTARRIQNALGQAGRVSEAREFTELRVRLYTPAAG